MNRNRMLLLGFFSLLFSSVVTYYAYRLLSRQRVPVTEQMKILVATEKLSLGNRVTDAQVRLTDWPKSHLPEGYFTDASGAVGRAVLETMLPNEPVLDSELAPREAGAGLAAVIPEGMRAMPVRVNDVTGVSGFVVPGTHVDVLVIGSPEPGGPVTSKIFMENVEVLAANQNLERDANGKPQTSQTVTLLVTPRDAQRLALAGDSRIQLVLRNPSDLAEQRPAGVQVGSLYGTVPKAAAPAPVITSKPKERTQVIRYTPPPGTELPARSITVEVIHGTKRESTTFLLKK